MFQNIQKVLNLLRKFAMCDSNLLVTPEFYFKNIKGLRLGEKFRSLELSENELELIKDWLLENQGHSGLSKCKSGPEKTFTVHSVDGQAYIVCIFWNGICFNIGLGNQLEVV